MFFLQFQETYEKRRETQQKELKQKEEEMRQMFVQRVKEKEQVLKETEREVCPFISQFLWSGGKDYVRLGWDAL